MRKFWPFFVFLNFPLNLRWKSDFRLNLWIKVLSPGLFIWIMRSFPVPPSQASGCSSFCFCFLFFYLCDSLTGLRFNESSFWDFCGGTSEHMTDASGRVLFKCENFIYKPVDTCGGRTGRLSALSRIYFPKVQCCYLFPERADLWPVGSTPSSSPPPEWTK